MRFIPAMCFLLLAISVSRADTIALSSLDVKTMHQDWGAPHIDHSVDNHPLSIGKHPFEHGIGTHAASVWYLELGGRAQKFHALVGVDDEVKPDLRGVDYPIEFRLIGDRKNLFKSGPMRSGDQAKEIDVDLSGINTLILLVSPLGPGITGAHGDWAEASILYTGDKPAAIRPPPEKAEILTPQLSPAPQINCAKVVGVRPNHPLQFMIATTGERPITFSADALPSGLNLDASTGLLSGAVAEAGTYKVNISATNKLGTSQREIRIEVGDKIALTPPMGWNSWNCFATAVSDEKVRAAADAMVNSHLIDHGWTYINIDDCWEVRANEPPDHRRAPDGSIKTNSKFPDMKALAHYIHSKGLRAGLYSSPGPSTCGNYTASYQFEEKDAHQYAEWGFDYLKYDWCSYANVAARIQRGPTPPTKLEIFQHPYIVMRDALALQNRDIVFSFCQYGMGDVWKWGEETGGNSWRTTDDINDSWGSMAGIGFNQNGIERYAGPGHWNDPDMLVVGKVGWGPSLHPSRLTPNEQYTHISLWSLLCSPLLIGCDMTQLDDFTRGLLTNDEVIAVNQDPLGRQAKRIASSEDETEVWAKDLEDGSKAVGLFNRSEVPMTVTVTWPSLGVDGPRAVRDLWRQKSLGTSQDQFSAEVPRHGVVLLKISPAQTVNR